MKRDASFTETQYHTHKKTPGLREDQSHQMNSPPKKNKDSAVLLCFVSGCEMTLNLPTPLHPRPHPSLKIDDSTNLIYFIHGEQLSFILACPEQMLLNLQPHCPCHLTGFPGLKESGDIPLNVHVKVTFFILSFGDRKLSQLGLVDKHLLSWTPKVISYGYHLGLHIWFNSDAITFTNQWWWNKSRDVRMGGETMLGLSEWGVRLLDYRSGWWGWLIGNGQLGLLGILHQNNKAVATCYGGIDIRLSWAIVGWRSDSSCQD